MSWFPENFQSNISSYALEHFSDFSEPSSAVSPMKKWRHRFDGFAMDQGKGPNLKGTLQDTHTQTLGWYIHLQIYHKMKQM